MKYLSSKSFSSPANSKAYVGGWERVFGEEEEPVMCVRCDCHYEPRQIDATGVCVDCNES